MENLGCERQPGVPEGAERRISSGQPKGGTNPVQRLSDAEATKRASAEQRKHPLKKDQL